MVSKKKLAHVRKMQIGWIDEILSKTNSNRADFTEEYKLDADLALAYAALIERDDYVLSNSRVDSLAMATGSWPIAEVTMAREDSDVPQEILNKAVGSSYPSYPNDLGGLPPQSALMTGRAIFTDAYAVIPKGVMRDIVTSPLPGWQKTRSWVIARPLSGFAETFAHLIMEVGPGGGSDSPEPDPLGEGVLFVVGGAVRLKVSGVKRKASPGFTASQASTFDGLDQILEPGGYAYLPAGCDWSLANEGDEAATFHWIRKAYEAVEGIDPPLPFVTSDQDQPINWMPDTSETWGTTRFVEPDDLAHDMHVNIVTFEPGGSIPFEETHVMEHGLYVLEGKAVYKLNQDWVEVEAGDYMWLRAFCPQACYAGGPGRFRYLLYKDMNRHPRLGRPGSFLR